MNRVASRKRAYTSPLREDQAKATRRRILDGVLAMVGDGERELAIPELSRRTGVSVPTIYRYFPTRADLLTAMIAYADELVPWSGGELDPKDLRPFLRAFFEHRAAVAEKLGPIGDTPLIWEARKSTTVPRRRQYVEDIVDKLVPGLGEPHRTRLLDILVVLVSHTTETAFRKYVDCTPAETAERVAWLIDSVVADAKKHKGRKR